MTVGVYGIFYMDECLYVGQSSHIEERFRTHKRKLINKTHIRVDFYEYFHRTIKNIDLLELRILEECENLDSLKNSLEIKWFNELNPKYYGKLPSLNETWSITKTAKEKISAGVLNHLSKRLYEKTCRICSKDFKAQTRRTMYCSPDCRYEGVRLFNKSYEYSKVSIRYTCYTCEKEFYSYVEDRVNCTSCDAADNPESYQRKCLHCEDSFSTLDVQKEYCTKSCGLAAFRKNNSNYLPKNNRFGITKENLTYLYHDENMKIDDIAKHFGCKRQTIYNMLNKYKIPKRLHTKFNK